MNLLENYGCVSGYQTEDTLKGFFEYQAKNPHLIITPVAFLPCQHRSSDKLYFDNWVMVYSCTPRIDGYHLEAADLEPPENKESEPAAVS